MIILDLLTLAPVFLSALFFPANGQSWAFHLFPSIKLTLFHLINFY